MCVGGVTNNASVQVPGYFFVSYEFELSNPLGEGATYTVVPSLPATDTAYQDGASGLDLPPATSAVVTQLPDNYKGPLALGDTLTYDDGSFKLAGDIIPLTDEHLQIYTF